MRVGLLHFCFDDYTVGLANALADRVQLTLIHPAKLSATIRADLDRRIDIRSFEKPRIRDLRNFGSMVEMMRIIRDVQPDVLHVQEACDPWYDFTLLFNKMPPLVTTIHDLFRHPGDRQTTFGSEYTRMVSLYRSQQIIVHSQGIQQTLAQIFRIPPDLTTVLPHGELGSLYQKRNGRMVVPREPHTLLFFGRIWPYKGLKYLVSAMPLVAERIPTVKLIVAGSGEDLAQYFPPGYDAQRYEILNDFIPMTAVGGLFQRSALTILPYIESSQSGVAALSYGMGTPVVASQVGGLSEIVKHGKDGFLVPTRDVTALAEAIVRALSDSDLLQHMQKAAVARAHSDLNWSTIAIQTIEVYQRAIESARRKDTQAQGA